MLRQQVRHSVDHGATIASGSLDIPLVLGGNNASFFEPIVLENINPQCKAYSEEHFGPVFSLFSVKNEQEAIQLANVTEYGLGAALFTKDVAEAERMARQLDAGMIYVNDFVQSQSDVPGGGVKNSG